MMVVHVAASHARQDGGPSETLRGLIPELVRLGVDVRLLSTDKGTAPDDADIADLCPVTVVRARKPSAWNFAPSLVPALWRHLSSADVVHIHSVNTFTTTVAMILSRVRRVPYIVEPHGALNRYHLAQGALKKKIYNKVVDAWGFSGLDGVVYSTPLELAQGSESLDAPAILMPLGVDEALFDLSRLTNSSPIMLFLGRVTPKKRLDLIIKALAEPSLSRSDIRLLVAGPIDADLGYDPEELAATSGVARQVTFLGRVDASKRRELLAVCDVFVLPSEDESFGISVAEAMAAGCAVVSSRFVGIAPEAAAEGALVLSDLSSVSVASAINAALSGKNLSAGARAHASKSFRWKRSATILLDAYREILATK